MAAKKEKKEKEKKIDLTQHEYRFNRLGLSERVKRAIIRALILIIPIILIAYWLIKVSK